MACWTAAATCARDAGGSAEENGSCAASTERCRVLRGTKVEPRVELVDDRAVSLDRLEADREGEVARRDQERELQGL